MVDKEWLRKKYVDERLSTYQIAKLCGTTPSVIKGQMRRHNIPYRSHSEAVHIARANHCDISKEAIEWINGELLGDGCLTGRSPYSASFACGSKYIEYIEYVRDTLKSFGIEQIGKINKYYHKDLNCYSYRYCSRAYPELSIIRKQWYPEGKKIIPKDIKLTSLTLRQHYIGDGCLHKSEDSNPDIQLCTCGFSIFDVDWFIKQLVGLGFKATRWLSNNSIHISAYSTKEFLKYIGKSPVKCYEYKFDY